MSKTNILQYYVDVLGEDVIIQAFALTELDMPSMTSRIKSKISPITNPIMRFMVQTVELRNGKIQ